MINLAKPAFLGQQPVGRYDVAHVQKVAGAVVEFSRQFRTRCVQHRVYGTQTHPAVFEVIDLANAGTAVFVAVILANKSCGESRCYLIGVIETIAAAETRFSKQLVVGECELGTVKIWLIQLLVKLTVEVEQSRFQGLQIASASDVSRAFKKQTTIQARQGRRRGGAIV